MTSPGAWRVRSWVNSPRAVIGSLEFTAPIRVARFINSKVCGISFTPPERVEISRTRCFKSNRTLLKPVSRYYSVRVVFWLLAFCCFFFFPKNLCCDFLKFFCCAFSFYGKLLEIAILHFYVFFWNGLARSFAAVFVGKRDRLAVLTFDACEPKRGFDVTRFVSSHPGSAVMCAYCRVCLILRLCANKPT